MSLSLANAPEAEANGEVEERPRRSGNAAAAQSSDRERGDGPAVASFEDAFEAELASDLGDLGPGAAPEVGAERRPRSRSRRR